MMGWITKQAVNIFGNQASLYFFGALLAWGAWAGYSWLQKHDAEIEARKDGEIAQAELVRAEQARDIYAESVSKMMDNRKKDEAAIAQLQQFTETQGALVNETLKQLDTIGGTWAAVVVPANRQRVLAISLKRIEAAANLSDAGDGTAASRAAEGLRDRILRSSDKPTIVREGEK